jgi:hypothetical protein
MGGVKRAVSKPIKKVSKLVNNPILNPIQSLSSKAMSLATGKDITNMDQLKIGAIGGAAIAGGAALGGAGAMNAGAASASNALSSVGGTSILSKVLLGVSAGAAISQMFNKPANVSYDQWKGELSDEDRQYVQNLEDQMNSIQSDMEVRNTGVQKMIDDFPNIMRQSIEQERSALSKSYNETTKLVLDQASNQLAAKYASTGGFSSGAFNEGLAKASTDVALERAGQEYQIGQREAQIPIQQYQMRLAETEALRDFQRTMLGGTMDARNSAFNNMMQRSAGMQQTQMQIGSQERIAARQERAGIFGSLGSLAGNYLMASTVMGKSPFGGAGTGAVANPNAGFATNKPMLGNDASAGYGA